MSRWLRFGSKSEPGVSAPIDPALAERLRAAIDGDEEARHQLVLDVLPRVRNGVRYLTSGDHVDDVAQDVLVTVLQKLHTYRGEGRFEAWVDGITLRTVLGRTRKLRKDERRRADESVDEVPLLHGREQYATSRQLVRALDTLPDAQRVPLVLHHVYGLTAPEIGAELRIPQETVRSRLKAALGALRAQLLDGAQPRSTEGARPRTKEVSHDE